MASNKESIRVLHVISSLEIGGGTRVVADLVSNFPTNVRPSILVLSGKNAAWKKQFACQVIDCQGSLFRFLHFLRKAAKNQDWDTIHFHGGRSALLGRFAFFWLKKYPRIIYTLHGLHTIHYSSFKKHLLLFFEKILERYTDYFVCVSKSDDSAFKGLHLTSESKIHLIQNGISIKENLDRTRQMKEIKATLHLSNSSCILLAACRLQEPKQVETIIRAMGLLKDGCDLKLLVVGDGPKRNFLERLSIDLQLKDDVLFLGSKENMEPYFSVCDIAILSTRWEGLPIFLLEASVHKKPLLGSGVSGVVDVIQDGYNGFLFEGNNASDLADKITQLQNPDLRNELGLNAFELVKKEFALEQMIEKYLELYVSK